MGYAHDSRLLRVAAIDRLLRRRKRYQCDELAELLGSSPRNVKRDIAWMRSTLNAPICNRKPDSGYYYAEPFDLATAVLKYLGIRPTAAPSKGPCLTRRGAVA